MTTGVRRHVTFLALAGSLALASAAHAQVAPPDARSSLAAKYLDPATGLSLSDAIVRALEQEPDLRSVRTSVDVARGLRQQADLKPNPMLLFSQLEEPSGHDRQTRFELTWPLDLYRKNGRVVVADREIDVARFTVADRERLLAADVRMKYGEVAAGARELAVLDELFAAASKQHALVAARVNEGAAPSIERDVLRVELQRLESERLLQSGVVERALIELKRTLGMAPDVPLAIRDDLEQLIRQEAVAMPAAETSSKTRSDVEAATARVHVADAEIERAKREGKIDLSVFGMYMRMNAGFPQQGIGMDGGLEPIRSVFHYVSAGATVMLPLRDRRQGSVAAAEAQRAEASALLDATRLTAQAEIAGARARDERARQAVAIYTSETRTLARQNLGVVGQTYELGRATVFDVLTEQRRYLEVERAFTAALREVYEARQVLRRALGDVR